MMSPKLGKKNGKKSATKSQEKKGKQGAAKQALTREVIYEKVTSEICEGTEAITSEDAKHLLGWEEVKDSKFLVKDLGDTKVRCVNNVTNRPIYPGVLATLKQEILRRRWVMNGEPIIIGKTGLILNGQHQLISLILACQEWEDKKERWGTYWQAEPVIDKLVVYGIDESDRTVNTMDTCKPRSFYDVLCRSNYFGTAKESDRRAMCRSLDYAVRLFQQRTGTSLDAFAPRKTHAESLDLIAKHLKILDCVTHIHEENVDNKIWRYVCPGYAAALLYLMGCSGTDPAEYNAADVPDESMLTWDRWSKACDFWVKLAAGGKEVEAVKTSLSKTLEETGASNPERWAILVNAWNCHVEGTEITEEEIALEYNVNPDTGVRKLAETPTLGGIDIGDPRDLDEEDIPADDPSPNEIQERAQKVREAKAVKTAKKEHLKPSRKGKDWGKGDVAWVKDPDGDHYLCTLTDDPHDCDDDNRRVDVRAKDGEWEVKIQDLSLMMPMNGPIPKAEGEMPKPKQSKPTPPKPKVPGQIAVGSLVWVQEGKAEPWAGRVAEVNPTAKVARVRVEAGFQGATTIKVVPLSQLHTSQPKQAVPA